MSVTGDSGPQQRKRLLAAVRTRLDERLDDLAPLPNDDVELGRLADLMVQALKQERHPLARRLDPLYDSGSVREHLGVDAAAIVVAVQRGAILEVTTSDHHRLYPAFQFDGDGVTLLPELPRVLAALDPRRVDMWGDAIWLREPRPELGDRSPAQALREGDADDVVALARQAGALLT